MLFVVDITLPWHLILPRFLWSTCYLYLILCVMLYRFSLVLIVLMSLSSVFCISFSPECPLKMPGKYLDAIALINYFKKNREVPLYILTMIHKDASVYVVWQISLRNTKKKQYGLKGHFVFVTTDEK